MARELKFRAWYDGEWLHDYEALGGCYLTGETIICGEWLRGVPLERMNEVIIEQYTGLHDRTGKEIYEGDVVSDGDRTYAVGFENGAFGLPDYGLPFSDTPAEIWEVIGTIHDANP